MSTNPIPNLSGFFALLLVMVIGIGGLSAQLLPPNQPEQDCINAIPVCQNLYSTTGSYQGEGLDPNEINSTISCLGLGEENDAWYIFSIQQAGNLSFTITPGHVLDDYDWAVYNLTNSDCSDIRLIPSLEVSCNYSGTLGVTGANGLGPCGFDPNCPVIPVSAGQTFVLNISNWNTPRAGYTLDFGTSTAVIFDTTSTRIEQLVTTCGSGNISIEFSEDLLCSSVQPTDFTVAGPGGPYVVTGITGVNCAAGGGYEDDFQLIVSPVISTGGNFVVTLVDTVLDRCDNITVSDVDTLYISIPQFSATAMPNILCPGDSSLLMTGLGTPGSYMVQWQPGSLQGDSLTVHPITTSSYIVTVIDTFNNCPFYDTVTVVVLATPTSTFNVSTPTVCDNDSIRFLFTGNTAFPAQFQWSFDNGNNRQFLNPSAQAVSWPDTGRKEICLTIVQQGCTSLITCDTIQVVASPNVAIVPLAGQCLNSNIFSFQSNASSDVTGYTWDLGDGTTSVLSSHTHSYSTPGIYPIGLTVTNFAGCSDTASTTISVFSPVTANYTTTNVCMGDSIRFFDASVAVPGEPIVSWFWSFGDGTTASIPDPVTYFNAPGTYSVELSVVTAPGCVNTLTGQVEVYPQPTASFIEKSACEQTDAVVFQNTSFFSNNTEIYSWDFGDGSFSSSKNTSHIYLSNGFPFVTLVATNGFGCADTISREIEVYPRPIMGFVGENVCMGDSTKFINQTSLPTGFSFASFQWNLGNGIISTLQHPTNFYLRPDIYPVTLIAESDKGCKDTLSKEIRVFANPEPRFIAEAVCQGDSMFFEDQSRIPTTPTGDFLSAWTYDFGDGRTQSEKDPIHIYQQDGFFNVILTVTSDKGCAADFSQVMEVYAKPSGPVLVHDSVCMGETAKLRVLPDSITQRVFWYSTFIENIPFWELPLYEIPDVLNFQKFYVQAVSFRGCEGDRKSIFAYPYPPFKGSIFPEDTTVEMPESVVHFILNTNQGFYQVNWDFGDLVQSDRVDPIHRYVHPGLYSVQVEILDENGCIAELTSRVEVKKVARAILANAFTPNNDGYNDGWELVSNSLLSVSVGIYDRYGKVLFSSTEMNFSWDGTGPTGKVVPEGVYVFVLRGVDIEGKSIEQSGTVTLIR
ncbi:PKD domain-containing protein [bacterium]|nr:PKD domain-containing protein [bacterium]